MEALRRILSYALIVALAYGALKLVRFLDIVHVPEGYSDIDGMEPYTSYRIDGEASVAELRAGDAICYRLGPDDERAVQFGWVVALPGDEVAIGDGTLQVNGAPSPHCGRLALPDCAGLRIPAQHLYVISDQHRCDSLARGPLPALAVRGRLGKLP